MNYKELVDSLTPQMYRTLRRALELGKWPDGRPLTPEQKEHVLQALITWGESNLPAQERIGFIDKGHKEGDACDDPEEQPLNWKN